MKSLLSAAVVAVGLASAASAATIQYEANSYNLRASNDHSIFIKPSGGTAQRYHFDSDARFTDFGSTASLIGRAVNGSGDGFDVDLRFDLIQTGPGDQGSGRIFAKGDQLGDESTWKFWDLRGDEPGEDLTASTLEGVGALSGVWDVISKPLDGKYTFQSGMGANDKNTTFGMSGWFFLAGRDGIGDGGCGAGSVCDFNLQFTAGGTLSDGEVPLPAPALLLIGGMVGLGGLRLRRKKAEG